MQTDTNGAAEPSTTTTDIALDQLGDLYNTLFSTTDVAAQLEAKREEVEALKIELEATRAAFSREVAEIRRRYADEVKAHGRKAAEFVASMEDRLNKWLGDQTAYRDDQHRTLLLSELGARMLGERLADLEAAEERASACARELAEARARFEVERIKVQRAHQREVDGLREERDREMRKADELRAKVKGMERAAFSGVKSKALVSHCKTLEGVLTSVHDEVVELRERLVLSSARLVDQQRSFAASERQSQDVIKSLTDALAAEMKKQRQMLHASAREMLNEAKGIMEEVHQNGTGGSCFTATDILACKNALKSIDAGVQSTLQVANQWAADAAAANSNSTKRGREQCERDGVAPAIAAVLADLFSALFDAAARSDAMRLDAEVSAAAASAYGRFVKLRPADAGRALAPALDAEDAAVAAAAGTGRRRGDIRRLKRTPAAGENARLLDTCIMHLDDELAVLSG